MTETKPDLPARTGGTEITRFNALHPTVWREAINGARR